MKTKPKATKTRPVDIAAEPGITSGAAANKARDTKALHALYKKDADALAVVANGLYHSHRQGVVLFDCPVVGLYDNNGGYPGRETMWAEMIRRLTAMGCEPLASGGAGELGEDNAAPYTRSLLVQCVFPGQNFIQTSTVVRRAKEIRDLWVKVKQETGVHDGHDVVLLIPADRRQDQMDAAIAEGIRNGSVAVSS